MFADSCRHGAQGLLDGASKGTLESEFGTSKEEECMVQILEKGDCQSSTVSFLQSCPCPSPSCLVLTMV